MQGVRNYMGDFELQTELLRQLAQNGLSLSMSTAKKIVEYLLLLQKWNQILNLTSIRHPLDMILRHIIDSLTVGPYLQGPHIIDVGTGAGLPGIPLALAYPHYHFTLLDSNGKKTRFLTHILQTLAIPNIEILNLRVEKYHSGMCFNTLLSRAFSQLNDFLIKTQHLCCEQGIFLAMKGRYPAQEIDTLDTRFKLIEAKPLKIVGLNEKRHVLIIKLDTSANLIEN